MAYVRSGKRGGTWELSRMLILIIKSRLGLDCRNTGHLYTGRSAHGPLL